MPSASKSKSKGKSAAKACKERPKVTLKATLAPELADDYNLMSGTFHSLETGDPDFRPVTPTNGKFRNIDETEEHSGSSVGANGDVDCASNNGSSSGESEDPNEKMVGASSRAEPVPGYDADKRDKIRLKNERKHQRQKERRAQELHDHCKGLLMSRKLKTLALQLAAMGFSSEQATMALIKNEGRLEDSVTWLFECGEESKQQVAQDIDPTANLKIDIADELARIAAMEFRFKCTKQEVERAVVSSEGDLKKAEEILQAQKQESAATAPKGESGEPTAQNPAATSQVKGAAMTGAQQQRRDERDLNYIKSPIMGVLSEELAGKSLQSSRRMMVKQDWGRQQSALHSEKQWISTNPTTPSVSYLSSAFPVASPLTNPEARFMSVGNEVRSTLQTGTLREPVIVMQRPQSANARQSALSASLLGVRSPPPTTTREWYSNGASAMEMMPNDNGTGHSVPNLDFTNTSTRPFITQMHSQPFVSNGLGGSRSSTRTLSSPSSLHAPLSLGLFSGRGSSEPSASSPVDWSTGGPTTCDYTSIDWSLDAAQLELPLRTHWRLDTWSTLFMGGRPPRPAVSAAGLRDSRLAANSSPLGGSTEWASSYTGADVLRASRKIGTYPYL